MTFRPRWRLGLLALAAVVCVPALRATPPVRVVQREHVTLRIRPMTAEPVRPIKSGALAIEIAPDRPAEVELALAWPEPTDVTRVRMRAAYRPPRPGAQTVIRLEAEVVGPERGSVRATRELSVDDSVTALFEIARMGERVLTFAVAAEVTRERVLTARTTVGAPVLFLLEVLRIQGDHAVPLETNRMQTFVGEPVAYSFSLGDTVEAESLRVRLTPLALYGEMARIEIEVSGRLPDGDSLAVVSRKDEWLTNRGAASSLTVEAGQPPAGFRFRVTPLF